MYIKKRRLVRLVSYALAVVAALCGYLGQASVTTAGYRLRIANQYTSSLTDLTNYLSNINDTVEKQMYTGTQKQMAQLTSELNKQTTAAKACLAQLPVSSDVSENIYKFLSQIGDYSMSLSKKLAQGKQLSEDERARLAELKNYADGLSRSFSDIQLVMSEKNNWDTEVAQQINNIDESAALSEFYNSVEDISQTETEYPTLIYDGPFSDHVDAAEPKLLENEKEITAEQARGIAAAWLMLSDASQLKESGTENSSISSYVFTLDGDVIAITRLGGHCLYFSKSRVVESVKLDEQQAVDVGEAFITEQLQKDFAESYYMVSDNICTINFAYRLDGTICYSDLIKVGVAMDSGEIMSVEARGFIMNHHERSKPGDIASVDEAKAVLSPLLTVQSSNTAIILTDSLNEYYCYEFICKGQNDEDILVFVNAETLEEEDIMILLRTDGGTLTR